MDVESALSSVVAKLGYVQLKEEQKDAILSFVSGKDVFVSLPTGFGKSLCYQCLPMLFDTLRGHIQPTCIIVVITPLVAIMEEQVSQLASKQIQAVHVTSTLDDITDSDIISGKFAVVYVSPEQLLRQVKWRDLLHSEVFQTNLVGFVIDEAHCVKKWGDDFRVEFAHLGEIRSLVPDSVHMMALTATATRSLRGDVCRLLGMKNPHTVTVSPDKNNIILKVLPFESLEITFKPVVDKIKRERAQMGRTIIFCQKQETCARLYLLFRLNLKSEFTEPIGYPDLPQFRMVDMFTSGTHTSVKESISSMFSKPGSVLRLLIATIAFGMGVNPPDVHYILHCGPARDIETYVQEIGRGGRDGGVTYATIYYSNSLKRFVDKNMISYCQQTEQCRRDVLYSDFDKYRHADINLGCKCCDVCMKTCTCGECNDAI